jgi:DUF971 family protein
MDVIPCSIERTDKGGIKIQWSDLSACEWTPVELRAVCPCATCKEKQKGVEERKVVATGGLLQVISLQEAQPLRIDSMHPVGNYAYSIRFSDGHSSGIFGFAILKKQSTK